MQPTKNFSRREVLAGVCAALAAPACRTSRTTNEHDITITAVESSEEQYTYRTPIKFGGTVLDRATILNVRVTVRNRNGAEARGFGSMPLGNIWAYPSRTMPYERTLGAMQAVAARIQKITNDYSDYAHPVEINHQSEPLWLKAAEEVSQELKLEEPVPKLATLVAGSPFDAAVHDAYGKLYKRSAYQTYTREFLREDLSRYLGPEFQNEYLNQFVLPEPKPRMPLYHLVGAVDPIVKEDIENPVGDGLPETLPEWIEYNGLTHLKIKLNGDNLNWDRDRVLKVEQVAAETMKKLGTEQWFYSLDFNERCPNAEYLLSMLRQVKEKSPEGFERIQYIEQPTHRDLKAHRENVMHEVAKLRPVVIDESLTELESLLLAREMGYTGAALKACKGQSQAMLMAAAAQKYKMFLCVQDLTCPGASLIHSAGIAAHIPGVAAIEGNSRQYCPEANKSWEKTHPGIFIIKDGHVRTADLNKPGLSAVAEA